jgi:tetratricopeptide (TPR) repeat protein
MNRKITTLIVFFFLAIYSSSSANAVDLYEQQLLNLGKMYEKKGDLVNAYHTYQNLLKENPESDDAKLRLRKIKPFLKNAKKDLSSTKRRSTPPAKERRTPKRRDRESGDKYYAVQFLTTSPSYRRQAQRKLRKLESYGLECYLKEGRYLYLRCNPVKDKRDLDEALDIAEDRGLDHFVVSDSNPTLKNRGREEPKSEPKKEPENSRKAPSEDRRANRGERVTPPTESDSRRPSRPDRPVAPTREAPKPSREVSRVPNFSEEKPSKPIERAKPLPRAEKREAEEKLPLNRPPVKEEEPKRKLSPKEKMLEELRKKREAGQREGLNLPPEKEKKPQRELSPKEKMLEELRKKRGGQGKPPRKLSPKEKMLEDLRKKREGKGKPPGGGKSALKPSLKPATPASSLSPEEKRRKLSKLLKRPKTKAKASSKFTLKEGYDALNGKNMNKAKEVFSDLIKFNPEDEGAVFGLALVFMNEGDWTKAYITLKPVAKKTKRKDIKETFVGITYNMYLKKGWKNVASRPDQSVKFFQEAQKIKDSSDISEGLSYAFNNNNESGKAIPHVMAVYKKKRDFKSAKMMVETYLKAEKKKEAEEFFYSLEPAYQANMKYNPKKQKAIDKVKKLIEEEKYREARGILRELYLLYPTDLDVLYSLGKVYESEKRYKKAIEYYRTVLSSEEGHKDALFSLSQIYMDQGKNEEAYKVLKELQKNKVKVEKYIDEVRLRMYLANDENKKAMELAKSLLLDNPTSVKLHTTLGELSEKMNQKREAYFYYARAYQMAPDDFKVRMKLLELLLEQKLFDQVQTVLGQFEGFPLKKSQKEELKDFYKQYYKTYTAVSLEDEDYEYALKAAKAGLQMMPDDMGLMESAGWAALNSKKYPEAVYYFSKIIAKEPDAYSQKYGLGLAYVNMKQMDKAKAAFKGAEATSDKELLYKIAGIYKDIGLKKDAYRVVKMLERGVPKASPKKKKKKNPEELDTKPVLSSAPSPEAEEEENKDSMDTYNPFLQDPPKEIPLVQPINDPEPLPEQPTLNENPVKKKSGRWF